MDFVTDLHLHSQYSRAVSQSMNLLVMSQFARQKGIEILSAADWTHPIWFREIKSQLEETKEGLFTLKNPIDDGEEIYFLLSTEISCIFSQKGKSHRMHNLILAPSFRAAEKIQHELIKRGANLSSDGRPIIGLTSKQLLQLILECDERAMLIPCHIWTPWFSLFGANSGFDSIDECFEDMSEYIYGIETGLSSDPQMNWQIAELDTRTILSFSDAHSPAKMGREETVLRLVSPSYDNIREAIMSQYLKHQGKQVRNNISYTIEFYPEEGKYHYNGHRKCNVYQTPEETRDKGDICLVCKRKITVGVMQRLQELSNRKVDGIIQENQQGLRWIKDPSGNHPPFVKIVPLNEIIAEALKTTVATIKVRSMFDKMIFELGNELDILLRLPVEEIRTVAGEKIAHGIAKVRASDIYIKPGYDNEYGIVKIWHEEKLQEEVVAGKKQIGIEF